MKNIFLRTGTLFTGIYETFEYPKILIDISDIKSLKTCEFDQNLILGANVSLEDCIKIFSNTSQSDNDNFGYLAEFAKHFDLIAHIPIRKVKTTTIRAITHVNKDDVK